MELADFSFLPLNAWADKLVDVSDIVETRKVAIYRYRTSLRLIAYNNVTKKRAYYAVPMKAAGIPFHIWQSLVEKAGFKVEDIPNTWDAFLDFFMPVQDKLRAQGMRNIYAYGYQLTANGVDPGITFQGFPDGLWRQEPRHAGRQIAHRRPAGEGGGGQGDRQADHRRSRKAMCRRGSSTGTTPTTTMPSTPSSIVMDFDGSLSTEVAALQEKRGIRRHRDPRHAARQRRQRSAEPDADLWGADPEGGEKRHGRQGVSEIRGPAERAERISEGRARPLGVADARNRQERPVLVP